ncbi:MAG: hypothetical protein R3F13_06010 [Prosthecobacter sp.]
MNKLPEDLAAFLKSADSLVITMNEGEVRRAELLPLNELKPGLFRVESEDYDDEGEAEAFEEFEGYSLLKTADGYDPDGVLVWFPDLKEYGAWDCDHLALITFPDVTWTEIIAAPTWFINGQWYPDQVSHRRVTPKRPG